MQLQKFFCTSTGAGVLPHRFGVDEPRQVGGRVALPGGAGGLDALAHLVGPVHAGDAGLVLREVCRSQDNFFFLALRLKK